MENYIRKYSVNKKGSDNVKNFKAHKYTFKVSDNNMSIRGLE